MQAAKPVNICGATGNQAIILNHSHEWQRLTAKAGSAWDEETVDYLATIMPVSWYSKEPSEQLEHTINWTRDLGDDTIVSSTWTVPSGLTENGISNTDTTTTIWLSGGELSKTYSLINKVVTAGGQTYRENINLTVARK